MNGKLLWIGDACVATGFARATHHILEVVRRDWDVSVLGINYYGDPHPYPYHVYPCYPGGDIFGLGRMATLLTQLRPDLLVVQNDPWNIPEYLKRAGNIPMVAKVAVDGKNCRGRGMNGIAMAVFWTKFAEVEARLGGYSGESAVVPLGVDLNTYTPGDRLEARKQLGLSPKLHDAFIIGNVNRNQQRKRFDLCVQYFAEWLRTRKADNAYLFFHTAPTGDQGYDVKQLAQYYGIANHLILAEPDVGQGVSEADLPLTYRAFDVMLTTTQGEGFGLPTFEGMACGIPQIVPDWSALGELCEDAAIKVPCTTFSVTPNKVNVIGGLPDKDGVLQALDELYYKPEQREAYREAGLKLVANPRYRWENIGVAFNEALERAVMYPVKAHG